MTIAELRAQVAALGADMTEDDASAIGAMLAGLEVDAAEILQEVES